MLPSVTQWALYAPWQLSKSWSWSGKKMNMNELPSRKALMVPFDSLWSMNTISSLKNKGSFFCQRLIFVRGDRVQIITRVVIRAGPWSQDLIHHCFQCLSHFSSGDNLNVCREHNIESKYALALTRWSTFDLRIETWARAPHLTERAGDRIRQKRNWKIRRPALQALLVYPGKWVSSGSFKIIMKIRHECDGLDQLPR